MLLKSTKKLKVNKHIYRHIEARPSCSHNKRTPYHPEMSHSQFAVTGFALIRDPAYTHAKSFGYNNNFQDKKYRQIERPATPYFPLPTCRYAPAPTLGSCAHKYA